MRAEVQRTWTARRQDTTKEIDMPYANTVNTRDALADADLNARYTFLRSGYTVEEVMTWCIEDMQHAIVEAQVQVGNALKVRDSIGAAL